MRSGSRICNNSASDASFSRASREAGMLGLTCTTSKSANSDCSCNPQIVSRGQSSWPPSCSGKASGTRSNANVPPCPKRPFTLSSSRYKQNRLRRFARVLMSACKSLRQLAPTQNASGATGAGWMMRCNGRLKRNARSALLICSRLVCVASFSKVLHAAGTHGTITTRTTSARSAC